VRLTLSAAGIAVRRPSADVLAGLVAGKEPEAGRNTRHEELRGQVDDAIDLVGLDDFAADIPSPVLFDRLPLAITNPATPLTRTLAVDLRAGDGFEGWHGGEIGDAPLGKKAPAAPPWVMGSS
jgi:hypothetical protein